MARATGWVAAAAVLAAVAAGCDKARETHAPGSPAANTTCVRCHGGGDNQTGAPPVSVTGQRATTFPGVGAHTAHVTEGALASAYDCAQCHPDPRFGSKQHFDGKVELAFGALATASGKLAPALDPTSLRCGSVYCHGATLTGGANVTPQWTKVGQGEAGCGTCHGVPPPAPHPAVVDGAIGCQTCHATTVDATGAIISPASGGKHVNGQVDFAHPPAFMDQASGFFHALSADRGLDTCQLCHGKQLDGGAAGVACASCHGAGWRKSCTMCHGGMDNPTGAPPKAIWGRAGDPQRGGGAADLLRVGAHTVHLAGSAVSPPFDCGVCHVKPADALSPGHLDPVAASAHPRATVSFLGIAAQGTTPVWDRASGTCSATYCHGGTLSGGTRTSPVWTGAASEAACGACHGLPPPSPHPTFRASGTTSCNACHAQTVDIAGQLIPPSAGGTHLDGQVEGTSPHEASWMDIGSSNFHAFTADRDVASCTACHGATLEGGVGPACADCHHAGGTAPDFAGCTGCHGGNDSATGGPPRAIWGSDADPARGGGSPAERATRVGAHTVHVAGSVLAPAFDCAACHVTPAAILSPGHIDGPTATVAFGALATTGGATPGWNRAGTTCARTYCHGATLSGGTNTAPGWTAGAGQAACGTCHGLPPLPPHPTVSGGVTACVGCHADTVDATGAVIAPSAGGKHLNGRVDGNHPASWMDQASADFHASHANTGLAACQACHGQLLDGSGPVSTLACAKCHGAGWATTCTMCHGGDDNTTGAPPKATWGQGGDAVRIGAHTPHVAGSAIAPAFDCAVCHVKPADAFAAGHLDGPIATVTFGGLAVQGVGQGVAWSRGSATCASTYCHGAFQGGNATNAPVWTGGAAQGACGTCHGLPPTAPHPAITGGLTSCNPCHPATIDASGTLIPPAGGGKHLDGQIEFTGGHDASWMDPTSAGFHAYSAVRGLASCQGCHGAALDGGLVGVACASCHKAGGTANDFATCTACHGGSDNSTGAPPEAIWGYAGDASRGGGALDLVRVGAHTAHVSGSTLAPAFDCALCHVKPATLLDAGHIDAVASGAVPLATVTFSGLAVQGTAAAFTRAGATCSTYCHGATLAGGSVTAPVWTAGASQAACGACHGIPPPSPHPTVTGGTPACNACHGATVDAAGNVIPPSAGGKHLDGVVQASGHGGDWMNTSSPGFHAFSADAGLSSCTPCHGAALDGGSVNVACASCHQAGGTANAFATCVACHGGTDNQTGAPPRATWGHAGDPNRGGGSADPVRVGAHSVHLAGSAIAPAFACEVCHVKLASLLAAGHVDQPTATLTFGGLATVQGAVPVWTRSSATCASTYCHGGFQNGNTANAPVWTGGSSQAACGTCHGTPPPSPHPAVTGGLPACNACHPQTVDATGAIIPPAASGKHLDGILQVTGHGVDWMNQSSLGFHAYSANQGLASCQSCHGAALDGSSVGVSCAQCHGAAWKTSCTMCHGGVDNATGAPPSATWGHGDPARGGGTPDPVRVGAHTTHVTASKIAPTFDCAVCHVRPADALAPGHVDQATATVTFAGLATAGGTQASWTRTGSTCSTYCHGATLAGGTNPMPNWTKVGQGQAACGTCHGLPPSAPHPSVGSSLTGCNPCHGQTIDTSGAIIDPALGGKHLDGQVEATGGHDAAWMDPASPTFHAFSANKGLSACQTCHGQNLDGVGGTTSIACTSCHGAGGTANDFGTCVACHGGTDNQTGAPPQATWGHAGDPSRGGGTPDPIRVGAHTAHVTDGPLAKAFDCAVCHVKPTGLLSVGHIDQPAATVTFGSLATLGTTSAPAWTRSTATCGGTYCHGATTTRGTNTSPVWTGGPRQAACGTCHGTPPDTGQHWSHVVTGQIGGNLPCSWCHAGFTETTVDSALHVNGTRDVIVSPDAADTPANAYQRINGWDSAGCHNAVACHGLMF